MVSSNFAAMTNKPKERSPWTQLSRPLPSSVLLMLTLETNFGFLPGASSSSSARSPEIDTMFVSSQDYENHLIIYKKQINITYSLRF
jgi:hypothetical protein